MTKPSSLETSIYDVVCPGRVWNLTYCETSSSNEENPGISPAVEYLFVPLLVAIPFIASRIVFERKIFSRLALMMSFKASHKGRTSKALSKASQLDSFQSWLQTQWDLKALSAVHFDPGHRDSFQLTDDAKYLLQKQRARITTVNELLWKSGCRIFLTLVGICSLYQEPALSDPRDFFARYPCARIRPMLVIYYMLQMAFYCALFVFHYRDRFLHKETAFQLLFHHAVAVFLFLFSWFLNFVILASCVTALVDVGDILLDLHKCFFQIGYIKSAHVTMTLTLLSWVVTRILIFPKLILWTVAVVAVDVFGNQSFTCCVYYVMLLLLVGLFAIHMFWLYLLARKTIRVWANFLGIIGLLNSVSDTKSKVCVPTTEQLQLLRKGAEDATTEETTFWSKVPASELSEGRLLRRNRRDLVAAKSLG